MGELKDSNGNWTKEILLIETTIVLEILCDKLSLVTEKGDEDIKNAKSLIKEIHQTLGMSEDKFINEKWEL